MVEEHFVQEFEVRTTFTGYRVVIAPMGEVDLLTAPEFAAVLDAVIDQGYRNIVLDLAGLEFLGAAGVGVVAQAAQRLRQSADTLTLRSPSAMVMRLLHICDLTTILAFEQPHPARSA